MRLDVWLQIYRSICEEFGYDEELDRESAFLLSGLLKGRPSTDAVLRGIEVPAKVLVCGDSESLSDELEVIEQHDFVAAADRAASVLAERGMVPDMIVTDLDGAIEDQVAANDAGSVVFVHAHGDNMPALREFVPEFRGPVVGTCQCAPVGGLHNAGGFTDGDRAVCICHELGARTVTLAGFDFEAPRPKAGRDPTMKKNKLAWARKILTQLEESGLVLEGFIE